MFTNFFSANENDLDGVSFKQKYEETPGAVLIDVRTGQEYQDGSIVGAKNMSLMNADFANEVLNLDKEKTYFLFCRSGNRSRAAAIIFEKSGLKAYNLAGGISAWPK